jgi:hypothetical protein
MTAEMKTAVALTPSQLVDALDALGVPFLRGTSGVSTTWNRLGIGRH